MDVIVAGLGCRSACAAAAIRDVLREAERRAGCAPTALAAPRFKAAEPGLHEAARDLGLELHLIERADLAAAQARTATRSDAAMRATGLASVAEAAALSAAGPGAVLVLARITGAGVTCALARGAA